MTGPRHFADDTDAWLDRYNHPEKYPWKQTGTKGLTIKTDCKNIPMWREVLVCHVEESKYAEYIVRLHNNALAANLQKGAGI